MVITEAELREMWRDGRAALPAFPPGTRFSPAAQDFLKDHRLEVDFVAPKRAAIPALASPIPNSPLADSIDVLHALTMLVAAEARRYQLPALAGRLDALAAYCLELEGAEQQGRDPAPLAQALVGSSMHGFMPGPTDHAIVHWLNVLRACARQASTSASGGLSAGLRQLSDSAAGLGRQVQSGELSWRVASGT